MIPHFQDRTAGKALQEALERYDALLAEGKDAASARHEALRDVSEDIRIAFSLATALPAAADAVPRPAFAAELEARIRASTPDEPRARRIATFPRFALAAAAAIIVFSMVLVPATHSLPGDSLYALKTASEDARVFVASGPTEARLRLSLANERFREVEQLVARSRLHAIGFGTSAAGIDDANIDPKLVGLIRETLQDAEQQVSKAAAIIIDQPHDVMGLDQLVKVTQRGQSLAADVAAVVPHQDKPPVLNTLVSLAKIEAQANAARMTVEPTTTPTPCPTPTEKPKPTPTRDEPTATPTEQPTATPTATPDTSPTASPTPSASPCVTSSPSPKSTPGADENVTTTPEPTSTAAATKPPSSNGDSSVGGNNAQPAPSSGASAAGAPAGTSG